MNLPTLRANPMGNKTCTQVIAGSSAHGATVRAISVLLPNEMANEIITRCNAYPALTARVKELEEALAGLLDVAKWTEEPWDTDEHRAAEALLKGGANG